MQAEGFYLGIFFRSFDATGVTVPLGMAPLLQYEAGIAKVARTLAILDQVDFI